MTTTSSTTAIADLIAARAVIDHALESDLPLSSLHIIDGAVVILSCHAAEWERSIHVDEPEADTVRVAAQTSCFKPETAS